MVVLANRFLRINPNALKGSFLVLSCKLTGKRSPVKMFLSSRQAGYSNRQQRQPRPEYKSDKCEVSGRFFVVDGLMAGCRHILTGLKAGINLMKRL